MFVVIKYNENSVAEIWPQGFASMDDVVKAIFTDRHDCLSHREQEELDPSEDGTEDSDFPGQVFFTGPSDEQPYSYRVRNISEPAQTGAHDVNTVDSTELGEQR